MVRDKNDQSTPANNNAFLSEKAREMLNGKFLFCLRFTHMWAKYFAQRCKVEGFVIFPNKIITLVRRWNRKSYVNYKTLFMAKLHEIFFRHHSLPDFSHVNQEALKFRQPFDTMNKFILLTHVCAAIFTSRIAIFSPLANLPSCT